MSDEHEDIIAELKFSREKHINIELSFIIAFKFDFHVYPICHMND